MKTLKNFNESHNFSELKTIVDGCNNILIDIEDQNMQYKLEPSASDDSRIKKYSSWNNKVISLHFERLSSFKMKYNIVLDTINILTEYLKEYDFNITYVSYRKDSNGDLESLNIEELKNIFLNKYDITNLHIYFTFIHKIDETLINKKSLKQLKKVNKKSKKTDISNKINNKKDNNLNYIKNPIDTGVETLEDFNRKNKIKKFNESYATINSVEKDCEYLLYPLTDINFNYFIDKFEFTDDILIEITKYISDPNDLENYTWDEIKNDFIPFLELLNEKYNVNYIIFHEYQDDISPDEYKINDLLNDDYQNNKTIQSIQILLS